MNLPPRKNPFEDNFRVYNSGWNDALDAVEQMGGAASPLVKELVAEIDELKRQLAQRKAPRKKPRPAVKMLDIGTERDGATIIDHQTGLHVVQCACGGTVKKSLYSLTGPTPWRCEACRLSRRRQ